MYPPTFHTMSGVANRQRQALHYQRRTTCRQGQVRVRIAYYSINFSRALLDGEVFCERHGKGGFQGAPSGGRMGAASSAGWGSVDSRHSEINAAMIAGPRNSPKI